MALLLGEYCGFCDDWEIDFGAGVAACGRDDTTLSTDGSLGTSMPTSLDVPSMYHSPSLSSCGK